MDPQTLMTKQPGRLALEDTAGGSAVARLARYSPLCIAILIATAVGVLVFRESAMAFLAAATDGVVAFGIVAAASLAGLWIVWATGNGDLPVRWQIGLGAGYGLGALSLGMLWAGMRGYMGQTTWWVVMAVVAAAGLLALQRLSERRQAPALIAPGADDDEGAATKGWRWLWLLVIPVVTLAILAATVPPGILWEEEANGYDVLEYHLGVPRDWFFAGRIVYLDHNMYSNFPMNAEMLYLLSMVLLGSPWKAAIVAQFLSLAQGALAGYVAWLIGRDYSRRSGMITGMAGLAMPWVTYFGALAYVENGMLFYGLLGAGLCSRAIRDTAERTCWRGLALGTMAGLACGYKYTAIPMVAAPLLGIWVALTLLGPRRSVSNAAIALILAATMFAPWAVKNQRMTGNAVFPLGYSVLGSRVWSPAQNAKFVEAHRPLPAERPIPQRFAKLWQRAIAEPRFGYVPWIAAAVAAALLLWHRMPHRLSIAAGLGVLLVQVLLWMFTTHLYARFAGVFWIPLVLLIAPLAAWLSGAGLGTRDSTLSTRHLRLRTSFGMAVCVLGLAVYGLVGQAWLWGEYNRHLRPRGALIPVQGAPDLFFHGRMSGFDHLQYINGNDKGQQGLPYNARLLMVGDARIYYVGRPCDYWVTFSSSPFAETVQRAAGDSVAVLEWLRRRGYTHVYADFGEMQRLSQTYGFALSVNRELFKGLEAAGLRPLHEVRFHADEPPYGILYEVPGS